MIQSFFLSNVRKDISQRQIWKTDTSRIDFCSLLKKIDLKKLPSYFCLIMQINRFENHRFRNLLWLWDDATLINVQVSTGFSSFIARKRMWWFADCATCYYSAIQTEYRIPRVRFKIRRFYFVDAIRIDVKRILRENNMDSERFNWELIISCRKTIEKNQSGIREN